MNKIRKLLNDIIDNLFYKLGLGLQTKLIIIFIAVKIIPLILLTVIAWNQINILGVSLRGIAVSDSAAALNRSATENIERMTTDAAKNVAKFLYERDNDILYLAEITPSETEYRKFIEGKRGFVTVQRDWELSSDKSHWIKKTNDAIVYADMQSSNNENNNMDGFNYRKPDNFEYRSIPLYDEITFIDTAGKELIKITAEDSPKINYPVNPQKRDIAKKENTYVKAENYFEELKNLKSGSIYVSDVIGVYVGTNYIGMYAPENVKQAAESLGYEIIYDPYAQAYAGKENPNGKRFEGIIRWAAPVTGKNGKISGYVTVALNHDHLMEFVDHITPMNERYTELPNANDGNYAFIWDYNCRSICHPRHHSIAGFDPQTGDPQIPWLESSIYEAWKASGKKKWHEFTAEIPAFDKQSRTKKPAPDLTKAGLVGLDGRYLNNAPQCTGWMDLTKDGGSGSFYILWSGLNKLTTAAAIPYYTGKYAPSADNGYSKRGFGFVAIGALLEDFTRPASETEKKLEGTINKNLKHILWHLIIITGILIVVVVLIAIWIALIITGNIKNLINGILRFRKGERQFRFNKSLKDEFGTLADSFDDMADSIIDSVKNPLTITDMDLKIIYMNEAALKFINKTLLEVIGKPYSEKSIYIYPANSKYCPIKALKEGHEAEIYYIKNKGRYIRGTANCFLDKNGKKIGYHIITYDVTEMLLEKNKIEEQKTMLDKVFSSSPDLIWYQDTKGRYLAVNPRFTSITGKKPEEFTGHTALEMFPKETAQNFIKNDIRMIQAKFPLYTEEKILFADGHEEILDCVRTPVYDVLNETLIGLFGFARNVTARVAIEKELRKTKINLEKAVNDANTANEHKGEFLARMSHEIRTPMNAIIGLTNIVQNKLDCVSSNKSEINEIKFRMNQIESSSQHLLSLLNDILDISKIEAGKIELAEEAMDINKLLNTVAGIIKPRCDEKNIAFSVLTDEFTHSSFLSDPLRLRQVLINLLGNAVKFTHELGKIEFEVRKKECESDKTLISFSIRDNGIGIGEDLLANIFNPFEQGGITITKKYGGTGLGLSISRSIVRLFGGDINVKSGSGKGCDFSFSIWFKNADEDPREQQNISNLAGKFAGKKILLVDDIEINRMIVKAMLQTTEVIVDEAEDGTAALNKFKDSPEDTYDIILMDIQMPNMDGYEASAAIRRLDRADSKTVPIIALTANAFKEDMDKALANGMNAHITKPVEIARLLELLCKYLA
ncbi:MAG: ATP-binding protein [Endomicrobia bacterium]|nr:ATP-binding protein [Endomicrobiia bacterium]